MEVMITEVQGTCIFLMAIASFFLVTGLPRFAVAWKVFRYSRNLLLVGTLLVMIHFLIQYMLHKSTTNVAETRTIINLVFGIPISYFYDISYIYVQHEGKVNKRDLWLGPSLFLLQIAIITFTLYSGQTWLEVGQATTVMAVIYAFFLVVYALIIVKGYLHGMKIGREDKQSLVGSFSLWTRWCMGSLVLIGLGFPLMTFNMDSQERSFYGMVSIALGFLYVLSFMGYLMSHRIQLSTLYVKSLEDVFVESLPLAAETGGLIAAETGLPQGAAEAHADAAVPDGASAERGAAAKGADAKETAEKEVAAKEVAAKGKEAEKTPVHHSDEWDFKKRKRMEMAIATFVDGKFYLKPKINKDETADIMGISRRMLEEWLKTTPYKKYNTWLRVLRIEEVKTMLIDHPELNMNEIADKCGFCNRQYLELQFTETEGVSPSKWMKGKDALLLQEGAEELNG